MFFRRRVSVREYCDTRLKFLFSTEQTRLWIKWKSDSSDTALVAAVENGFLDEVRGAHLQLMYIAVMKEYHNFDMAMELSTCASSFLERTGYSKLDAVDDEYNRAFGSTAVDGVLAMARLFSERLAEGTLSSDTVTQVHGLFYAALSSFFDDFKKIKIVPFKA